MHFLAFSLQHDSGLCVLLYQCWLYTRSAYTWFWLAWPKTGLVHELFQNFLATIDRNKNSYMHFLAYSLQHHSGLCVCFLPVPAIYKNCIYVILAYVAQNGTFAWTTPKFLLATVGPKQEQLHVFSCIFTATWFWLVRLFPTSAGYIQELLIHDSGLCDQKP